MRSRLAKIILGLMLVVVVFGLLSRGCAKSTPPKIKATFVPASTTAAIIPTLPAQIVDTPTAKPKPKAKWGEGRALLQSRRPCGRLPAVRQLSRERATWWEV